MAVNDTFTVGNAKYTVIAVETGSVTAAVDGTPATTFDSTITISDSKSISGDIASTQLFTLTGIATAEGITINGTTVTLKEANLDGKNVSISGGNYTLALASDVPAPDVSEGKTTMITSSMTSITTDGVYKFAAGYSGDLTISATNVKLIGAGSQLSNVYINVTAYNANLWIKNLNIKSSANNSVIKFGSGTKNYLTVEGTNTLENTASNDDFNQALINVGGGLNIIGDEGSSLTAKLSVEQ